MPFRKKRHFFCKGAWRFYQGVRIKDKAFGLFVGKYSDMLWLCVLEYAYIPSPPILAYQNIFSPKISVVLSLMLRLCSFRQGRWYREERKIWAQRSQR